MEATANDKLQSLKNVTTLIYALYALALLGVGITGVVAIVLNYLKLDDARGTWLESHFRAVAGVWFIYRIAKGWLNLNDNQPMYPAAS